MIIARSFVATIIASGVLLSPVAARPLASDSHVPDGARYVAMGSSFAAGSGITPPADVPANRCTRSAHNYAHQLARKRRLRLVDVSCGGATTAHVLGPWMELPAQIDSLTADTALVTMTIGGNDVRYIGRLIAGSCKVAGPANGVSSLCGAFPRGTASGNGLPPAAQESWRALEQNLRKVATEVRRRSPRTRLIFVDYLSVLPERGPCDAAPLSQELAAEARATATRLAELTARVAPETGADIVRASDLSRRHDACSADPWTTGFKSASGAKDHMPYHPDRQGMTKIADVLHHMLARQRIHGKRGAHLERPASIHVSDQINPDSCSAVNAKDKKMPTAREPHTGPDEFDVNLRHAQVLGSGPRIASIPNYDIDADSWQLVHTIRHSVGAPRVTLMPDFMRLMAKHPAIFRCQMQMGTVLFQSTIPPRERELAILRISWLGGAPYEWGEHVEIGKRHGISTKEISRVIQGSSAAGWSEHEAAILRGVEELIADAAISDATWITLARSWTEQQLIEYPMMVGQYLTTAFILNSLRVQLPEGNPGLTHR